MPASILAWPSCQTGGVQSPHERLAEARLYLVCDDQPDRFLVSALRGGVDVVQLRMKQASDAEILRVARRFARTCRAHDALFILNDRPDLVVEAEADGVHVGQEDVPVESARGAVGSDRIVGLSTHNEEQIRAASGVDYIGVGPVHETPTKPGRPAVGLELVGYAAAHAPVPFFAIGGLTVENVATVRAAGATRIAVVRALTEASDPQVVAHRLRSVLTSG